MSRNARGFLKSGPLKGGLRDQYAVRKGEALHEITILHDHNQGGYVTQHVIVTEEVREVHAWQFGDHLNRARNQYRKLVRSIGGQA